MVNERRCFQTIVVIPILSFRILFRNVLFSFWKKKLEISLETKQIYHKYFTTIGSKPLGDVDEKTESGAAFRKTL